MAMRYPQELDEKQSKFVLKCLEEGPTPEQRAFVKKCVERFTDKTTECFIDKPDCTCRVCGNMPCGKHPSCQCEVCQ